MLAFPAAATALAAAALVVAAACARPAGPATYTRDAAARVAADTYLTMNPQLADTAD